MCRFVTQDALKHSFGCKDSNYFVIMQADGCFLGKLFAYLQYFYYLCSHNSAGSHDTYTIDIRYIHDTYTIDIRYIMLSSCYLHNVLTPIFWTH